MKKILIYHNPNWSKSKNSLRILEDLNIDYEVINYLKDPPSIDDLKIISKKLNLRPKQFIRKGEKDFLNNSINCFIDDDTKLFELMNMYPKIIERPIILINEKGCIGRPPENIYKIIWIYFVQFFLPRNIPKQSQKLFLPNVQLDLSQETIQQKYLVQALSIMAYNQFETDHIYY